ncbi:hypothetical protein GH714_024873 [Hevea brasiliensis]|uniref:NB-ARC domain-containing protein n=1 Tax=Hevea brasiliensis TaxID=3981 RepID=A0A6A6N6I2_HEVBR|nr:hypothetical protein GH714_024873 [Hevea brasiliensis]
MEYCFHRSKSEYSLLGSGILLSPETWLMVAAAASAGASAVVVEAYKDVRNAADSIDQMRYYEKSLDKNYEKLQDVIKKLYARKEGSNFGTDFLVERSAKPIIKAKAPKIEDKPSLSMVFEEILECLKDKRVTRIGLWGQVGAGKTTIMQNLRESEEISELFDIVFYVTLADEGNEERLQERVQHQIAEELQLDLLQGSTDAASKISKRLESMRFLLLLDDVWGTFDLDDWHL